MGENPKLRNVKWGVLMHMVSDNCIFLWWLYKWKHQLNLSTFMDTQNECNWYRYISIYEGIHFLKTVYKVKIHKSEIKFPGKSHWTYKCKLFILPGMKFIKWKIGTNNYPSLQWKFVNWVCLCTLSFLTTTRNLPIFLMKFVF